jgi:uncharacterized damage-inducible protein DinB
MSYSELLLPEFDQEMANTRKVLQQVPDGNFSWKPHEKSMTLGRLASHVAELPSWAAHTIEVDKLVLGPDMKPLNASTRAEILEAFEKNIVAAREAIAAASDEHLNKIWQLEYGGHVVMSLPRIAVLRGVVMNHLIHHRAQLGVYLRLNDVAVPGMYGPSADEPGAF